MPLAQPQLRPSLSKNLTYPVGFSILSPQNLSLMGRNPLSHSSPREKSPVNYNLESRGKEGTDHY